MSLRWKPILLTAFRLCACFAIAWLQTDFDNRLFANENVAIDGQSNTAAESSDVASPKQQVTISGHVTNPDGSDADVVIVSVVSPDRLKGIQANTDSAGKYELKLEVHELEFHEILLRAENKDQTLLCYVSSIKTPSTLATGRVQLDAQLSPSRPVVLNIVDENQFPVADAQVLFFNDQTIALGPFSTDATGTVRTLLHDAADSWSVIALKKEVGFCNTVIGMAAQDGQETKARIVLEKSQPMRIQLNGNDKMPVVGAQVGLLRIDTPNRPFPSYVSSCFDITIEETDDSGEAWLDAFPFGIVTLGCHHPNYEAYTVRLDHKKGPEFVHKISLRETAINRCRVVDENGTPLANHPLTVRMSSLQIYKNQIPDRTDENGIIEFTVVVGQAYMISARTEKFGAIAVTGFGLKSQTDQDVQDLRLTPFGKITGTVRDKESQKPIENRAVHLLQLGAGLDDVRKMRGAEAIAVWSRPVLSYVATSDKEGRFLFEVPAGEYNISLYAQENHSNRFRLPSAEDRHFELTVEK